MPIRVLSFDFDGCLFNNHYLDQGRNLIPSNQALLDKIKTENRHFTKIYTFVGSNRQSLRIDKANSIHGKPSCFPAIQEISDHLQATLDKFLLADIYGDLEAGSSYEKAINRASEITHSDWIFDETKATILYAQIHKIAIENPDEEIIFDFYDDRGLGLRGQEKDILESLSQFYSDYPQLLPKNVTLRLNHYAGQAITATAEIKGTGHTDIFYRQTVKDMANQLSDGTSHSIDVAANLNLNLLYNTKFTSSLMAIKAKAEKFRNKADSLLKPDEVGKNENYYCLDDAATATTELYDALESAATNYFKDGDKAKFKAAADTAIDIARNSSLKNHRGHLKQILSYAGLAVLAILTIATAGIAYAVAGGINYAVNRQFFFSTTIKTDSMNKIDEIENNINTLTTPG